MKFVIKAVLLSGLFLATSIVWAAESGPARSELEKFAGELERFKADFTQTVKSQDGRIQVVVKDKFIDMRFSSLPGIFGEKVVLRVLDKSNAILDINNLGIRNETLEKLKQLLKRPYGLILTTGPTGSGKTTTLYSAICFLNSLEKNIVTIEDPVEYQLDIINQNQTNDIIGLSFPRFLKHVLRQDPDVILVGELRDAEAIAMAMMAAETGHLVLGTLHTSSATKTLDRFLDGLPPDQRNTGSVFLAQNLRGVVSQALVRRANSREKIAMVEILVMTDAIGNLVLNGNAHQIPASLQTGKNLGMQLMDQALLEAVQSKTIDPDDAYLYALDKRPFQKFVTDPQVVPKVALLAS